MSPNSYGFGAPDASTGRQLPRVVVTQRRLAEGAEQVAQRLEAEEVRPLLRQLELDRALRQAELTTPGGIVEGLAVHRLDVTLAHEPLDCLLNELVECVSVTEQPLEILIREQPAANQGIEDRVLQCFEAFFIPVARELTEAALQEEVRKPRDQVLEIDVVPEPADVAVVADRLHRWFCRRPIRWATETRSHGGCKGHPSATILPRPQPALGRSSG